ncbi:hypothetical protein INT46_010160 [Mucor plumbeus]|uniref:Uncharacterized protein n=1 Tax=Mucor plumbeus TaxID=97098 RepID=A0A8H7UUM7_9FUNG|nr:hypothetical protein INT46_010160 [Mucor plumbeus]
MYPTVGMATLSKYRREFLAGAQASTSGRSSKVSTDIQQYIARMPQVQGSGDGIMFWGYISGNEPGYGTAIIDGTIDSNEYVEILKTSLMQALEYYGKQVKVFVFSK